MPKVIPDLHERILATASELFSTIGYTTTDMKTIGRELGISVGTLYNYFPSKPDLFLAVTLSWRSELIEQFRAVADGPGTARQRLQNILQAMLQNSMKFTGIWKEFLENQTKGMAAKPSWAEHHNLAASENDFFENIRALLLEVLYDKPLALPLINDPRNRFVMMLFMPLVNLAMRYPEDTEGNELFLKNWIAYILPEEVENENTCA